MTIAGSDSCGGAGIQADIKTITCNKVYAMSAITALTAQNTTGVFGIMEVEPEFLQKQIDAVVTDIFPDSVKVGMVSSAALIKIVASSVKKYGLKNVVVDPVMVATSGAKLMRDDALEVLKSELLPIATLVTPNIPEAEILSGIKILSEKDMEIAAKKIFEQYGSAVLLKGGHCVNDANDFLFLGESGKVDDANLKKADGIWFFGKRINNPNTHGTGCTLSSAIAANFAKGEPIASAVKNAKSYISGALNAMLDLGKGSGPMAHNWNIK